MLTIKVASVVAAALAAAATVLCLLSSHAEAAALGGAQLSLGWRLAASSWIWYVRVLPFAAIVLTVGALLAVAMAAPVAIGRERNALGAWLAVGFAASAAWHLLALYRPGQWVWVTAPLVQLGAISWWASAIAAFRVVRRRQAVGTVRAWHVGLVAFALAMLGDVVLLVGLWVWRRSGTEQWA